ncbi:hypothetical protein PFISCL1PPCAC_24580, partial [Pristionchus fissidentatus]
SLTLVVLVGCAIASLMQYPVKVGEKIEFNLGKNVKEYQREIKGGKIQKIRFCGPTERNVACGKWVDEKGTPVASGAVVKADGTLLIEKATLGDAGSYSAPSENVRIVQSRNGAGAVAGLMIDVSVSN